MQKAGGGSIINISSNAGIVGLPAGVAPTWRASGPCAACRKSAAQDLGPLGIRVNSVHPGGIATPMVGGGRPTRPAG